MKMNDIIVLKLNTQEEIIGKIEAETEEAIYLSKPRSLHVMDMGNGQAGASFVPPMLLANDSQPVWILKQAIAMKTLSINAEYEKRYLESVSGISLATSLKG
jgi:hypothetical protein